jgi:hypothetical protein
MPLNQTEAEKIAKLVADRVFDQWQRDSGITKEGLKEILVDELTKTRHEDKKSKMDDGWGMYGIVWDDNLKGWRMA